MWTLTRMPPTKLVRKMQLTNHNEFNHKRSLTIVFSVIGGWGNTRQVIRRTPIDEIFENVQLNNLLTEGKQTRVLIQMTPGSTSIEPRLSYHTKSFPLFSRYRRFVAIVRWRFAIQTTQLGRWQTAARCEICQFRIERWWSRSVLPQLRWEICGRNRASERFSASIIGRTKCHRRTNPDRQMQTQPSMGRCLRNDHQIEHIGQCETKWLCIPNSVVRQRYSRCTCVGCSGRRIESKQRIRIL